MTRLAGGLPESAMCRGDGFDRHHAALAGSRPTVGNVIVDAVAGERAQQNEQRKQRDQQARAEQHDLAGKVEGPQLQEEVLRERSFEPVLRRRPGFVPSGARRRCFPLSGTLAVVAVRLRHHAALFRRLGPRTKPSCTTHLGRLAGLSARRESGTFSWGNVSSQSRSPQLLRWERDLTSRRSSDCSSQLLHVGTRPNRSC